jgi:phosphoglycerate dehydrogenase-like enzyme
VNKSSQSTTPPAVFIATHDAEEFRDLLLAEFGSDIGCRLASSEKTAVSAYNNESVVLGRPDYLVDLLNLQPPVTWVQSTWAGVNLLVNIGFNDYLLTGIKNVFGPQMAEYALCYMLAHEIRVSKRLDHQKQQRWDESPSGTLHGKVLGIMGTGSIGCYIASTAANFEMRLIGLNTSGKKVPPFDEVYRLASLPEFLAQCDYVIGLLPDLPASTNLLDESAFGLMKETAFIINVGRGNLIDDKALCKALETNQIAGAALDVFLEEPLPANNPLWDAPNLLITGHIAADSKPADIARVFADNYRRFLAGDELLYKVDFEKGY